MDSWSKLSKMLMGDPNEVRAPEDMLLFNKPFVPKDSKLNFEQRILTPSRYPVLNNEDGSIATHRMAWGEVDGKQVAYPTVVQKGDQLVQLDDRQAFEHAMQSGEFRSFDNPTDAENYARGGYKKQWGAGEPKPSLLEQLKEFNQPRKD